MHHISLTHTHAMMMMRSNKNELILKFHFLFHPVSSAGLLDTITSTENSKDCPGVCVHALATLICYDVLEEVKCPSSGMKCCVESSSGKKCEIISDCTFELDYTFYFICVK